MGDFQLGKIIQKQEFLQIKEELKKEGKKIILCHGVFDLVHPGHIIHFREAKSLGDVLVVSITAAQYVRKGPGRPYFDDNHRLEFLAAIEYIDYVLLSEGYTVDDMIETVEPDLYVKGQEYSKAEDDITGMIDKEIALVRAHGGDVYYTGGQVFSSTKLINTALSGMTDEVKSYMQNFKKKYQVEDIKKYLEDMQKMKVLVVGDTIIDEYIFCQVQGLMSKNVAYSARENRREQYLGGTLAIARHIADFAGEVIVTSVIGADSPYNDLIGEMDERIKTDFVCSEEYPTIVKQRFVSENAKRDEIDKVFVINNIPGKMKIDKQACSLFTDRLKEHLLECDVVVLCDFGHGLINHNIMEMIEKNAKFLVLNCQTNSSNYGTNLITKYHRANAFSVDEKELKLAFSDYNMTAEEALRKLAEHLHGCGWCTLGSEGADSIDENKQISRCPALTLKVKDTIGAGDAFFSLASLCAAVNAPWEVGAFMGNIAGALMANVVGNKDSLNKVNALKYVSTLMNV